MRFKHLSASLALLFSSSAALSADSLTLDLGSALGGDMDGFERARVPRAFVFPADHGPHPAYKNEWWYLTGQLFDQAGQHYGFQFTLFRVGLSPPSGDDTALWPRDTVWMAHAAISDNSTQTFYHAQRLSHGGAGTAGVTAAPFAAWLDDWRLGSTGTGGEFPWRLRMRNEDFSLDLSLLNAKPPVRHGDRGLSQKGGADNASYYFSYTDIRAEGTLDGKAVSGSAWFDREWSSSLLGPEVEGWDWFSLQLADGRQVMVFQLRDAKPPAQNTKSGTLIEADGRHRPLSAEQIELTPLSSWYSSRNDATYPTRWRLEIEGMPTMEVAARFEAQEQSGVLPYWEGSVTAHGPDGLELGMGYLEMTGYRQGN